MKYKRIMIMAMLLMAVLSLGAVSASENVTDDVSSVDDATDVINLENSDVAEDNDLNNDNGQEVLGSGELHNNLSLYGDEKLSDTYPPYDGYSVTVDDTTINYGSSGSIVMRISSSSGYTYAYDFFLKIYDSGNSIKVDKQFRSTSSASSVSYTVYSSQLSPGTYTIKIYNHYDSKVMDTAKLTVKSSSSTLPYSAYSLSVSNSNMTYGSTGTISMGITPASSYYYKYNFYMRIYDSNNAEKISKRYYSTSSDYSRTYTISSNQLDVGVYTVKLVNYDDSKVMATAKLIVKSSSSYVCPSYSAYDVSVFNTTIDYGSSGYISMKISPASGSTYKYYYYLKVYDSQNNERISKIYYSNSFDYSQTYSLGSNQLAPGVYAIMIVNFQDDYIMSTAKLTVKSSTNPSYYDYSVSVSDTIINYGSSGYISMKISPSSKNYKYNFYLKVYDSDNVEMINKKYSDTKNAYSKSYTVSANQLSPGNYTIKIVNSFDDEVMSTANLIVKHQYPSYSDYSVKVSDTTVYYGSGGSIAMNISSAPNTYKYNYYLKVYDSNGNEVISQAYASTSSANSKTYSIGSNQLNPGTYAIKIINYYDNHVMSTAQLHIKKIILETGNMVGKCNGIIQYRIRASENDLYKSGLRVTFNCNGDEKTAITDDGGYATLKIHLKAGTHDITIKCGNALNKNTITVNKVYVANKYKAAYVKQLSTYYKSSGKIKYGWKGNLEGYFKIYKGSKVVYQTKFNTNGYINDYFKYAAHNKYCPVSAIKNVGLYRTVITDKNGKVLAKSAIKISKHPTHIKCSSFVMKAGTKKSIKVYVYDKSNSRKNIAGVVNLKINGKTYGAKVKNGVAVIKNLKFPSKVKTYVGNVKFLGNNNYKASSKNIKVAVRMLGSEISVLSLSTKTGVKNTIIAYVDVLDLSGDYREANGGTVKFTINGETYYAKVKNGKAEITITAPYSAGTYTCKAVYLGSDSVKKSSTSFQMVVKKKSNLKTAVLPVYYHEFVTKRLSNKDVINVFYEDTPRRQYSMGVSVWATHGYGLVEPKYTKLVSSKVWFMNDETGGVITRTSSNVRYDYIHIGFIRGYTPYKVQVWYK